MLSRLLPGPGPARSRNCKRGRSIVKDDAAGHKYYRHRFHYRDHFGQVGCCKRSGKWWQSRNVQFANMVSEIADWLLGYSTQDKTGAFIVISQTRPVTPTGVSSKASPPRYL